MIHPPRGALCDRARGWAALAPDGELSELERKLLQAHLLRCEECRAFADDVVTITLPEELRTGSPREKYCPGATSTSRPRA